MNEVLENKPEGEYIEIFVSDWNKDYWYFYDYITMENYPSDIKRITDRIKRENWRDGDWYVELIDRTDNLLYFYKHLYGIGEYTQSDVLNIDYWDILSEHDDLFFLAFDRINGGCDLEELKDFEYMLFQDWDEALECFNPDLSKVLDENNAWGCFDSKGFLGCQNFYEVVDERTYDKFIIYGGY